MKEQCKYDKILLGLLDQLQRILIFADKVADEIVIEETGLLETIIPQMFKLMQKVAVTSCDYIKHGKWSCSGFGEY